MAENPPPYRPRNAIILLVLYAALFGGFLYFLFARQDLLAAEDLPLSENSELHLLGSNFGMIYAVVLLLTPIFIAGAYMSASDAPPKPRQ